MAMPFKGRRKPYLLSEARTCNSVRRRRRGSCGEIRIQPWACQLRFGGPAEQVLLHVGEELRLSRACFNGEGLVDAHYGKTSLVVCQSRHAAALEHRSFEGHQVILPTVANGGTDSCDAESQLRWHFPLKPDGVNLAVRLVGSRLAGGSRWTLGLQQNAHKGTPAGNETVVSLLGDVRRNLRGRRHSATTRTPPLRSVRLPAGWAGLSFRASADKRLFVTDVPKACFSSAAFGQGAAAQVEGVKVGDEIVRINGDAPAAFAAKITKFGDILNTCSVVVPPHAVGSIGKHETPPCVSCDFARRRESAGLDVALQLWMRAEKRNTSIVLDVKTPAEKDLAATATRATSAVAAQMPTRKRSLPAAVDAELQAKPVTNRAAAAVRDGTVSGVSDVATSEKVAPTLPAKAAYNPLRPAVAMATHAVTAEASGPSAKTTARALGVLKLSSAGFACEELKLGNGIAAQIGDLVTINYKIRLTKAVKKSCEEPPAVERGEVSCRLGEGETLDGWMDGNVDIEEVLATWGRALVGMRVGGRRRVLVPPKSSFREGGGEAVPKATCVLFDVDLRKLG